MNILLSKFYNSWDFYQFLVILMLLKECEVSGDLKKILESWQQCMADSVAVNLLTEGDLRVFFKHSVSNHPSPNDYPSHRYFWDWNLRVSLQSVH